MITDLGAAGTAGLGGPTRVITLGNGDILIGGTQGVARLLPGGSLDPAFGSGGVATLGFTAGAFDAANVTVQPGNGDIIWAGDAANTAGGGSLTQFAVERFTASGAPDKTFGRKGVVTTDVPTGTGGEEGFNAVVVQPDGKIVAGGGEGVGGYRAGHSNAVLVRYNPDGTLDTSFGTGGIVVGGPFNAQALGLDAAGDIFTLAAGDILDTANSLNEAEFSPAGVPDASVTAAPVTASSPGSLLAGNGVIEAFAFLPTGQTLAGGEVGDPAAVRDVDAQVQRLNAGGTLDPAFASPLIDFNGIQAPRDASEVNSLAIQPDGKILVGGNPGLARLNAGGTLDTTFGTGGTELKVPSPMPDNFISTSGLLAVLPNGEFLAIGEGINSATGTGPAELILTRYFQ